MEALPEKYFNDAHLPDAIRIDHTEIMKKAPKMLRDKSRKTIVYCASRECENSSKAARIMEQLGYENILVYKEGKEDWIGAGLTLESGIK